MVRVVKQLEKIKGNPEVGKPLRYELTGHRSIRIPPFRIIYRIENDSIMIVNFDNREDVYD